MKTTGAVQSNLVRIATADARRLGMPVHIQLEDRVVGPGHVYRASGKCLGWDLGYPHNHTSSRYRQRWLRVPATN